MEVLSRHKWISQLRYVRFHEWRTAEEDRGWEAEYIVNLLRPLLFTNIEMKEWLESNTIDRWNVIWDYWLEFENEIDAMAFKLRWM